MSTARAQSPFLTANDMWAKGVPFSCYVRNVPMSHRPPASRGGIIDKSPDCVSASPAIDARRHAVVTDPTELVIVQHAEKDRSPGDPGLTERGRQQATTIATLLARAEWNSLYCSPLWRARETAAAIGEACALDVLIDDRLRERMNWGSARDAQTREAFLADWRRASTDRSWTPPSGESSAVTGARFLNAINEYAARAGPRILVVSHGGATVDLLRTMFGDDEVTALAPTAITDGVSSCALTQLAFDRRWTLVHFASDADFRSQLQ
jgi:broad specificity phosphatase PhoE